MTKMAALIVRNRNKEGMVVLMGELMPAAS